MCQLVGMLCGYTTDKGECKSRIPSLVMALSAMGLKLGVFGFLTTTHTETNAKQMHPRFSAPRAVFFACLSSCSDCSSCRLHTHLNHGWFDYGKITWWPTIWAPCRDKNGAGSGICCTSGGFTAFLIMSCSPCSHFRSAIQLWNTSLDECE